MAMVGGGYGLSTDTVAKTSSKTKRTSFCHYKCLRCRAPKRRFEASVSDATASFKSHPATKIQQAVEKFTKHMKAKTKIEGIMVAKHPKVKEGYLSRHHFDASKKNTMVPWDK